MRKIWEGISPNLVPQQSVWPPEPDRIFDGGQVHFAVGSDFWLNDSVYVESYEVDPYTGQCGVCRLDEGYKTHAYHYGVTDEPGFRQGHAFRSTAQPACWYHYQDHSGIPNMLTPPQNPMLTGTVCVVKGSVDVGDPIPHQDGDPATSITYRVEPAETILAPDADAVVVEVYYPGYESFKKRWEFSGGAGITQTFYWDGLLDLYDGYGNLVATNVGYCPCSTVFARITVKVQNHYWNNGEHTTIVGPWTWEMPPLAITAPSYNRWFKVGDRIQLTAVKSNTVTEPLTLVQWSAAGGTPSAGTGAAFATSYTVAGIYNVAASLLTNGGVSQIQTRIGVLECIFTHPAPGTDTPTAVGYTLTPAGAPLRIDGVTTAVTLTARDANRDCPLPNFRRCFDSNGESATFIWNGLLFADGYHFPVTQRTMKDVFLSATVRLRTGSEDYDFAFDEVWVAVGTDLGTFHNEVVTSSIARMTAYSWPSDWGGTHRVLTWNFRNEQKLVVNDRFTTFTVSPDAIHTLSEPLTCNWVEWDARGPLKWKDGSQPIRVFFARTASNDPDGGETSGVVWCNWFYHYAQDHMAAIEGYWASSAHELHFTTVTWYYTGIEGGGTLAHPDWTTATVGLAGGVLEWPLPWGRHWHSTETLAWVTYQDYKTSGELATPTTFSATVIPIDFDVYYGLDSMQWSVAHENVHVRQSGWWHFGGPWRKAYGVWQPGVIGNDFDGDVLPDAYEDTMPTNWRSPNTWQTFQTYYNLEPGRNDLEVEAEREAQHHTQGWHERDLARPGSNSDPPG